MANLNVPYSDVMIGRAAANLLDDYGFASFDDPTPLAQFFVSEYGLVRDECLMLHPWAFAKARAVLAPGPVPAFGWRYAYQLPADYIRCGTQTASGIDCDRSVEFAVEGDELLSDTGPVFYFKYGKRVTNPTKFPPLFARLLACRLAANAATKVTGKLSFFQKADAEFQKALQAAVHVDSLSSGKPTNYDTPYDDPVSARYY